MTENEQDREMVCPKILVNLNEHQKCESKHRQMLCISVALCWGGGPRLLGITHIKHQGDICLGPVSSCAQANT